MIAVSPHIAEQAVTLGVDPERIRVIRSGVDTDRFQPRDRALARSTLGIDPSVPLVLFVGNLEAQILYAGRAPGFAGLDQINFIVPAGAPSGDATPLRVESNGSASNAVTLPIL